MLFSSTFNNITVGFIKPTYDVVARDDSSKVKAKIPYVRMRHADAECGVR